MTVKWAVFIILCALAACWIVYGFLKAFNGILYEIDILRNYWDAKA